MADDWPRPVVHWEMQARDAEQQRAFYAAMFNWTIGDGPIMDIGAGIGGVPPEGFSGHLLAGDAPRFVLYIQVLDLKTSMAKAKELGGSVLAEPFDMPGGPTVARIADPEGNHIGLIQQ